MSIKIFGISHKTAPIEIRERLAVDADRLPSVLRGVVSEGGASEALILSTCNRTELYCNISPSSIGQPFDWLVQQNGVDTDLLASHGYTLESEYAVRHALRVACGLDSMVLGEPQILGQLKDAYRTAVGEGTAGKVLNKLFQHSFHVAKQIRTQTAIGENPVSVAYAAVKLAQQIHGDLSDKTAMLVGAGDTITLVAHHLRASGIEQLIIANRTFERSQALSERVDGTPVALEEMPQHLAAADIVVSSTGSRLPVITTAALAAAVQSRRQAPIFVVDLAVPRDVEAGAADIADVYLYSVDDLNQVVGENTRLRESAAAQAEEMINIQTESYMDWLQSQDSTQAITAIRNQAEMVKDELLNKARRRLEAGDDTDEVLANLAHTLVNRLLHTPTVRIREAGAEGQDEIVRIARNLLDSAK